MKQIILLLFFIAIVVGTISLVRAQSPAQETQTHGYWSDPSTGLMWAAKDNGTDITWGNAMKYCQNLGLAGGYRRLSNCREFTTEAVSPPRIQRAQQLVSQVGQGESFF